MTKANPDFNIGIDVDAMLAGLPEGLDRLTLGALAEHVGRKQAVSRNDLLLNLGPLMLALGVAQSRLDRALRLSISQLRKAGLPICSTGGPTGGYFLASNRAELDDYLRVEVHSRAMDLLEQEKSMRAGAARLWGNQPPLI